MLSILKNNQRKFDEENRGMARRKYYSPATYGDYQVTTPIINQYIHGNCIDIGCGDMPYKDIIMDIVSRYDTLDIERHVPEVKFLCDVHNMNIISDNSYDSALCLEVLEHVMNPFQAVSEIYRILKKDGTLILTVPHLSRLHDEPYDYFRYTKYGLQSLLESVGFEILRIVPRGGLFSFIGHQCSTIFLCSLWHIPVLKNIAFIINKWLCVRPCYFFDKILDKSKIIALGYTCVAEKS